MENNRVSNYDITRDKAQKQFLTYDIAPMVQKYGLSQDTDFTYISFLQSEYRISRQTGCVERLTGKIPIQAGFEESMTLFDVLCYAKKDATPAGQFSSVMQLDGVAKSSNPGGNLFQKYANRFQGRSSELKKACEALGGIPYPVGEVAYQIPLFDFLPVVLQFWDADVDFDAQLILKWDNNTLHYMHFETTFYAAGCLLQKIVKFLDEPNNRA